MPNDKLWPHDRRAQAQKVLTRLIDVCRVDEFPVTFQLELDFRALDALCDRTDLADHEIMAVVTKIKAAGKNTIEDFEAAIFENRRQAEEDAAKNSKNWLVYVPLSFRPRADVTFPFTMRLLGHSLRFTSWEGPIQSVGLEKFEQALQHFFNLKFQPTNVCVQLNCRAHSQDAVWQKIKPAFEALRGILELTFSFGQASVVFPTEPRSRRAIAHPHWLFACDETNTPYPMKFSVENDKRTENLELTKQAVDRASALASQFKERPSESSVRALFVDVLRLYTQAMDANENHLCFVALWQLAEVLTLADRYQGSKKVVCHRLAWMFRESAVAETEGLDHTLEHLYDKRCNIVHEGVYSEVCDEDVNFLKSCCELAINWLLWTKERIDDLNALDFVFTWAKANSATLSAATAAIRFLKFERPKAQTRR